MLKWCKKNTNNNISVQLVVLQLQNLLHELLNFLMKIKLLSSDVKKSEIGGVLAKIMEHCRIFKFLALLFTKLWNLHLLTKFLRRKNEDPPSLTPPFLGFQHPLPLAAKIWIFKYCVLNLGKRFPNRRKKLT